MLELKKFYWITWFLFKTRLLHWRFLSKNLPICRVFLEEKFLANRSWLWKFFAKNPLILGTLVFNSEVLSRDDKFCLFLEGSLSHFGLRRRWFRDRLLYIKILWIRATLNRKIKHFCDILSINLFSLRDIGEILAIHVAKNFLYCYCFLNRKNMFVVLPPINLIPINLFIKANYLYEFIRFIRFPFNRLLFYLRDFD